MERMFKKVLSLSLLFSGLAAQAECNTGSCGTGGSSTGTHVSSSGTINSVLPNIVVRSPGANALRRMTQSVGLLNKAEMDKIYGAIEFTPEYTRSFNSGDLATCLFGSCALQVQGSGVANRDPNAILADYLYLPANYQSTLRIDPVIQTFSVDMFGWIGLDEWVEGLYAWVQFPVTWSKWNLGFCESNITTGTTSYPAGYFTPDVLPASDLLTSAASYFQGNAPTAVSQSNGSIGTDRTVTFNGLCCSRIGCKEESVTTVPEVRFALGWNFLLNEDYHLGVNIQASGPSGKKADHKFLFSVQNGNDGHWELGGAVGGHFILWRNEEETSNFGFYLDANFTHLFNSNQTRCFDLCEKPLSRYMLAEQMVAATTIAETPADIVAGGATIITTTTATFQFSGLFSPVANITSTNLQVSVGVQADIVAMFNYTNGGWSWDLGYNFWYRSCEKFHNDCSKFEANTWALKGDSQVFGFDRTATGLTAVVNSVPLSATQNSATITGGLNAGQTNPLINPKVDNPALAFAAVSGDLLNSTRTGATVAQVNTSIQPIFIQQTDINYARNSGLSNKVFSNIGYNWIDREDIVPFVGVGFEAEFGSSQGSDCGSCETECGQDCDTGCDTGCDTNLNGNCLRCSLSQWGIWIKGGVAFN